MGIQTVNFFSQQHQQQVQQPGQQLIKQQDGRGGGVTSLLKADQSNPMQTQAASTLSTTAGDKVTFSQSATSANQAFSLNNNQQTAPSAIFRYSQGTPVRNSFGGVNTGPGDISSPGGITAPGVGSGTYNGGATIQFSEDSSVGFGTKG
ncbi:MAG: hypothetical protein H7839_11925 [Magnetococcus sp. YQC-5]